MKSDERFDSMPMRLGIFARTFSGPSLDAVLDAVVRHGVYVVQFNLSCAGLATVPENLKSDECERIRAAFSTRRLEIAAISGTYNTIDPDRSRRESMTIRAIQLIRSAPKLGTRIVTLCSGSRDPLDMWRAHADNDSAESWRDLLQTLEQLLPVAEAGGVILGIEPEGGNVINSAKKARQLLDEVRSSNLRVILDGANLWNKSSPISLEDTIREAFELIGAEVALVHAKEIPTAAHGTLNSIGSGRMNWNLYFDLIKSIRFNGPVVIHNVAPTQVDESLRFIQAKLTERNLSCGAGI